MIYGERIRLRAVERDDLPRFVAWLNDPEVRVGLQRALPMSMEEEKRWYESMLQNDPAEHPLSIDVRESDDWVHIGSCGLHKIDPRAHHAELGIAIGDKAYWDQGYGTDAMQTLLRHAFETLNLYRVYLRVFENNPRAIRVYRRLGFQEEGRLRDDRYIEGRYMDTFIMGILRSEWEAIKNKSKP